MRTAIIGTAAVGLLLAGGDVARAQQGGLGIMGGFGFSGGAPKPAAKPAPAGEAGGGGLAGFGGMAGLCGFGGMAGLGGFGGCCGGFSGLSAPQQFYTGWTKFPGRGYYHRDLHVTNAFGGGQRFVVVHHPNRPHYFYFFDPVTKQYFGRYRPGTKDDECFALVRSGERKRTLVETPEAAFQRWGPMPRVGVITGKTGDGDVLSTVQLQRPPDPLPGHDLPPDED